MVNIGDTILIDNQVESIVTTLFQIDDGRWFIGYETKDGYSGFFLEMDKDFMIVDKMVDKEVRKKW